MTINPGIAGIGKLLSALRGSSDELTTLGVEQGYLLPVLDLAPVVRFERSRLLVVYNRNLVAASTTATTEVELPHRGDLVSVEAFTTIALQANINSWTSSLNIIHATPGAGTNTIAFLSSGDNSGVEYGDTGPHPVRLTRESPPGPFARLPFPIRDAHVDPATLADDSSARLVIRNKISSNAGVGGADVIFVFTLSVFAPYTGIEWPNG